MKVWLLYCDYYDGEVYDSQSSSHIFGVVDSEEKARAHILKEASNACKERIDRVKENLNGSLLIDEDGPYIVPWTVEFQDYCQLLEDELYFYETELSSLKVENKCCEVKFSNDDVESLRYYYKETEVE